MLTAIPVDRNVYPNIYLDLTYKCNLRCPYCFNPQQDLPSMRIEYFEQVCAKLPSRVTFRFLGGEPTLHPDFFDFLRIANKYRHVPTFVTNGVKLGEAKFVDELASLRFPFFANMSMDGGRYNDDVYEEIVGKRCSQMKMKSLQNMVERRISRIGISAILIRGFNESVIPDLIELAHEHRGVQYLRFRSVGLVGRFRATEPFTVAELKQLVQRHLPNEALTRSILIDGRMVEAHRRCFQCCYHFRPDNRLTIGLTEFASENSMRCWKRGKLKNESFEIVPYFEDMHRFSECIPKKWKTH